MTRDSNPIPKRVESTKLSTLSLLNDNLGVMDKK